uniref:Uncharacterized protein n=1 Tax=Timema monikensis TaxID=170555 RepID=A0A7R9HT80_9NEOP|nr:unnamed protein product [Timema monikensis]
MDPRTPHNMNNLLPWQATIELHLWTHHVCRGIHHPVVRLAKMAQSPKREKRATPQESRHILAALLQHITFTEFLPLLLGKNTMQEYKLNPSNESVPLLVSVALCFLVSLLGSIDDVILASTLGVSPLTSYSEDKYDPDVNPTVTSSFITAAFRFGHSLLPNVVERWSSTHKFIDDLAPWKFVAGFHDGAIEGDVHRSLQ